MKINLDQQGAVSSLFKARSNQWAPKYEPSFWVDCSTAAYDVLERRYLPYLARAAKELGYDHIDRSSLIAKVLRTCDDSELARATGTSETDVKTMRNSFMKFLKTTCMSTNCYAYALNVNRGFRPGDLLTPGYLDKVGGECAQPLINRDLSTLFEGLAKDGMNFFEGHPNHDQPPEGYYLAALLVHYAENGKIKDYHFVRYDRDGACSHKLGHGHVSRLNFNSAIIVDPTKSGKFGDYEYQGSIMVPAVLSQLQQP